MDNTTQLVPDKRLAAVCGLFCPACPAYIATHERPEKLEGYARLWNCTVEEMECEGCRADKRCVFCEKHCKMTRCAAEKGLDFCGECADYPCEDLKDFQARMPNRIELWQSLDRIREVGLEQWYAEMIDHYSCPDCGTLNSVADPSCRKCGRTPSCRYVELHKEQIEQHMARRSRPAE